MAMAKPYLNLALRERSEQITSRDHRCHFDDGILEKYLQDPACVWTPASPSSPDRAIFICCFTFHHLVIFTLSLAGIDDLSVPS